MRTMRTTILLLSAWPALYGLALGQQAVAAEDVAGPLAISLPSGVVYDHVERTQPRPLQIHVLKIDLQSAGIALGLDVAPDPDGDGPAETTLVAPLDHATRSRLVAAVNANAWRMLPDPKTGRTPGYIVGGACDMSGWVVADGQQHSPPQGGYWSFWVASDGSAHLGDVATAPTAARWAIAGFGGLIRNGEILPQPSDVRHPRTALGLDRQSRTLILAVIDGRQSGYSEGLSERELAELMAELGCHNALNLDGGGSSVMVLCEPGKEARIMNRPSDRMGPRPIPVLFGVR